MSVPCGLQNIVSPSTISAGIPTLIVVAVVVLVVVAVAVVIVIVIVVGGARARQFDDGRTVS
jgi:hypothetical protein